MTGTDTSSGLGTRSTRSKTRLGSRRAVSTFSRTRFAQGFAKSRVIGIGAGALRSRGPSNNGRTVPGTGTVPQTGGAPHDVFRVQPPSGTVPKRRPVQGLSPERGLSLEPVALRMALRAAVQPAS